VIGEKTPATGFMRTTRLYTPQAFIRGEQLTVAGQTAHHLAHVLRIRSGATVQVFDGKGCEHRATVKTVKRSEIILGINDAILAREESSLDITLLQGIARNDRMDLILQKAVELGVNAIQPLWMQRSQAHLNGKQLEKRRKHWLGVIISACEQCGRATLPKLDAARDYSDWMRASTSAGVRLLLQPDSTTSLSDLDPPGEAIQVLVGPEGGLTLEEQTLAISAGFTGIHLGPRILRTETAALAILASIQARWGDFS
jgi:16S rRNA (uracil1498-N3)-methyltransferase